MTQPQIMPIAEARAKLGTYSVSKLQAYSSCAYAYYLDRVLRVPGRQATWFIQGTATHDAIEAYEKSGRLMEYPEVLVAYHESWISEMQKAHEAQPDHSMWMVGGRKTWETDRDQRYDMGMEHVDEWMAEFTPNSEWQTMALGDQIMSEVGFELGMGSIAVIGYIDLIMENQTTGEIMPVDIKTGSKKPADPYQLGTYKQAVERILNTEVTRGAWWMSRNRRLEFQNLVPWTWGKVSHWYNELHRGVNQEVFTANPENCFTCTVKPFCAFGTENPLAIPEFDPPG